MKRNSISFSKDFKQTHVFPGLRKLTPFRSSRLQMILKIGALKNFVASEKHLCWSLFILKLQTWRPPTLLKRDSNTVVFQGILRNVSTAFSIEHLKWLLLSLQSIYVFTIPSYKGLEVWIWYRSWFFFSFLKLFPSFDFWKENWASRLYLFSILTFSKNLLNCDHLLKCNHEKNHEKYPLL